MHVPCWHFSPPPHSHGRSKLASHATAPALARVAGMIMLQCGRAQRAGLASTLLCGAATPGTPRTRQQAPGEGVRFINNYSLHGRYVTTRWR